MQAKTVSDKTFNELVHGFRMHGFNIRIESEDGPTTQAESKAAKKPRTAAPSGAIVTLRSKAPRPMDAMSVPVPDSVQAAYELKADAMFFLDLGKFDKTEAFLLAVEAVGTDVKREKHMLLRARTAHAAKQPEVHKALIKVEKLVDEARTLDEPAKFQEAHKLLDELEMGDRYCFFIHRILVAKNADEARKEDEGAIRREALATGRWGKALGRHHRRWGRNAAVKLNEALNREYQKANAHVVPPVLFASPPVSLRRIAYLPSHPAVSKSAEREHSEALELVHGLLARNAETPIPAKEEAVDQLDLICGLVERLA